MYLRDQEKLFNKGLNLQTSLEAVIAFTQNEQDFTEEELLRAKANVKDHIDNVKTWWTEVASSLTTEASPKMLKKNALKQQKEDPDNDLPF